MFFVICLVTFTFGVKLASVGWAKARSAVPTSASTQSASQYVGTLRFAHPTLAFDNGKSPLRGFSRGR